MRNIIIAFSTQNREKISNVLNVMFHIQANITILSKILVSYIFFHWCFSSLLLILNYAEIICIMVVAYPHIIALDMVNSNFILSMAEKLLEFVSFSKFIISLILLKNWFVAA